MDKLIEIETKVNELVSKYRDIVSVGYEELDRTWKELDEYRKEAHKVFQDYDASLHRDENGRFSQETYNIAELAAIASKLNEIDDRCYDNIHRLHVEYQRKRDLYNQKNAERRTLNLTNRRYALQIEKLINRNKQLDAEISLRSGQYPELANMFAEEKKSNEALIDTYRSSMELFDLRLANYAKELDALKKGGEYVFEEDERLGLDSTPVKDSEDKKEKVIDDKKTPVFVPGGQVKDDDFKNGFKPIKDDDFKEGFEDESLTPPIAPVLGELTDKEEDVPALPVDPDDEEELAPPVPPVLGGVPDSGEEVEEEVPALPVDPDDKEEEEVLPVAPIDPDDEVEDLDEEEEEVVAPILVEETAEPKPTLFQKIKNAIYKAILVLGGLSATALTVDHFVNHHDMATVEEEITEDDLEQVPDQNQEAPSITPDVNPGINPDVAPTPTPNPTPDATPDVTPDTNPDVTPGDGDNTGNTDEDQKDPIQEDNTTFPIELGSGEVAYNYETGVEVTQDGSAYLHQEDGDVINQEDRNLDTTDHGTSVVIEEDLYPDLNTPEQTFDEQIAAVPETGQEQTYTEAVNSGELTQGEQENLDAAFDALESYFNEEYVMQP